tara:strand:- start:444 stop:722 length:279 start_codon:yes stop_codon:yes gene_type:complete
MNSNDNKIKRCISLSIEVQADDVESLNKAMIELLKNLGKDLNQTDRSGISVTEDLGTAMTHSYSVVTTINPHMTGEKYWQELAFKFPNHMLH